MYRIRNPDGTYYRGDNGWADIGKVFRTESGAKQVLRRYYTGGIKTPEYPRDEIKAAGQDHTGPIARAYRDKLWATLRQQNRQWHEDKHKPFNEIQPGYTLEPYEGV